MVCRRAPRHHRADHWLHPESRPALQRLDHHRTNPLRLTHNAFPIPDPPLRSPAARDPACPQHRESAPNTRPTPPNTVHPTPPTTTETRSEEHTSELQSQSNIVCRLLLA